MDNFMDELKRFVRLIDSMYTNDGSIRSNEYERSSTVRDRRRLRLVASWVIRLYWNLLYLIDLPVDFFKQPRFPSDSNVSVNCYVPNEYISIFAILSSLSDGELDELRRVIRELLDSSSSDSEEHYHHHHHLHSTRSLRSALKNVLFCGAE